MRANPQGNLNWLTDGVSLARQRHTPNQILAKLRDADVMLADDLQLAGIARRLEISEQTYHPAHSSRYAPHGMRLPTERTGCGTPIASVLGLAAVIAGGVVFAAEIGHWNGPTTAGAVIAIMFGGVIGGLSTIAWRIGPEYLDLDLAAGTGRMVRFGKPGDAFELERLWPLSIESRARPGLRGRKFEWFELRAAGLPDQLLFSGPDRAEVEARLEVVESSIDASALRRVLASTTDQAGAFCEASERLYLARQAVPDPERLRAAATALERDPDPAIAARTATLHPRA